MNFFKKTELADEQYRDIGFAFCTMCELIGMAVMFVGGVGLLIVGVALLGGN